MAISLDATISGESANSYATVDEANTFLELLYGADEWAVLSDEQKMQLLITASKQIDKFEISYSKDTETQALCFPVRTDPNGFEEVREACIVQALWIYQNGESVKEGLNRSIQGVKSESLGKVSQSISGYNPFRKVSPEVMTILADYIDFSFGIGRG